jgi:hypothetical protein
VAAAVFGFMAGYIYRDRFSNWYQKERIVEQQPDISGQIMNASIQDILQPKTAAEAVADSSAVYSFTGYVRALEQNAITVERSDDTTEGTDAIDFILTDSTVYSDIRTEIDATGVINRVDDAITQAHLGLGDIVTVYSLEDIRTAAERHITKVERISAATH